MPLFYQQDINLTTKLGVWKIEEEEIFFLAKVPLQRNITHLHKRLQHLAGRYLLPFLFPDFPHAEIEIADTRKPFLPEEQYHFSISHCGEFAAAIVSRTHRPGIDIEMITHRVEKIQHKFLHPEELVFVQNHAAEKQTRLLTLLWSVKEAMFKWWGRGEVDFREALRIGHFSVNDRGTIPVSIDKDGFHVSLLVQYILYEKMTLAWIVS